MRIKPIKIGQKEFRFKKDAILYYRNILNSYNFGESLCDSHFNDLVDLLNYNYFVDIEDSENNCEDDSDEDEECEIFIEDIKVSKVQFNTKCFEVFYSDDTSTYISYIMIINNTKYSSERLFNIACRSATYDDIRAVKQAYFDENSLKGQVRCQETGLLSKWTELVVDHRQPNTFSVIVDRFKEINNIELDTIEYRSNECNLIVFDDDKWTEHFRMYHKEKANLRIVRTECNSRRTGLARLKRTSKDLIIK